MVGYDEVRTTDNTGNTISIRTAEYGDMGSISIPGITFQNIPGFFALNKGDMNKFLAEKDKLLEKVRIYNKENVEKVIEGSINYKVKGQVETQEAWLIVYKEYDKDEGKEVTKMALVAENGWYAKAKLEQVEANPSTIGMETNFPNGANYTQAFKIKGSLDTHEEKGIEMPRLEPPKMPY